MREVDLRVKFSAASLEKFIYDVCIFREELDGHAKERDEYDNLASRDKEKSSDGDKR